MLLCSGGYLVYVYWLYVLECFFGVRIAVIKVMESKLEIVRNNSDSYDEIDIILDRKDDEDIETDCPLENEGLQEDLNIEEESYKEEIIAASEKTKELEEIKEYEEEEENEELENDNSKRYILPNSDSIYLTEKDLRDFSAEECRFARNEIYARHGRKFNDEELQAYFDRQDWYRGRIDPDDFTEDMLNEYELYNRDFIVEFEEKQGYR